MYIYFGGVWKGFGSEYIYLSYTIECNFIRVSRGSGGVWKGLGHDIYIYRRSKRCESLALYGTCIGSEFNPQLPSEQQEIPY